MKNSRYIIALLALAALVATGFATASSESKIVNDCCSANSACCSTGNACCTK